MVGSLTSVDSLLKRDIRLCKRHFLLATLVLLAASEAMVLCFAWSRPAPVIADGQEYRELAQSMITDGSFPSALRAPGYPAFVAGVWAIFGESLGAVRVVQGFILTLAIGMLVVLGLDLLGWRHRWIVFIAAAAVGLNPEISYASTKLMPDSLSMLLVPLVAWLCIRTIRHSWRYGIALGAAMAAVAYVRSEQVVVPVLLLTGALAVKSLRRRTLVGGLLAGMVMLAGVGPWVWHCRAARGYTGMSCACDANIFHRGWYLSPKGQIEPELRSLLIEREGFPEHFSYAPVRRLVSDTLTDGVKHGNELYTYRTLDFGKEAHLYKALGRIGKENIPRHLPRFVRDSVKSYVLVWAGFPLDWLWSYGKRVTFRQMLEQRSYLGASVRVLSRIVWPLTMLVGMAAGLLSMLPASSNQRWAVALTVAASISFILPACLATPSSRFRTPYDGVFYMLAFTGMAFIASRMRHSSKGSSDHGV